MGAGQLEQIYVEVLREGATPVGQVLQQAVDVLSESEVGSAQVLHLSVDVLSKNVLVVELDPLTMTISTPAVSLPDKVAVSVLALTMSLPAITVPERVAVGALSLTASLPAITLKYTQQLSVLTMTSSMPSVTITGDSVSLEPLTMTMSLEDITEEFEIALAVLSLTVSVPAITTDVGSVFLSPLVMTISAPQPFTGEPPVGDYFLAYIRKSGSDYNIVYRTSADFVTWSGETVVVIGGIDSTKKKYNVSVFQERMGDIFLFFDVVDATDTASGVELINVYYSKSSDGGATWSSATAITAYSTFGTQGTHPYVAQKLAGEMTLVYTETLPSLIMDDTVTGYCGSIYMYVTDMHFDSVSRKLYIVNALPTAVKYLSSIMEINVDTWEIDNCWNCATVPAFNDIFCEKHIWWNKHHGERYYQAIQVMDIGSVGSGLRQVALLNANADTIRHYVFETNATYGLTQNVNWSNLSSYNLMGSGTWVDFDSSRLYVLMISSFISQKVIHLGYFDITDDTPNYNFVDVVALTYSSETQSDESLGPTDANMINHLYSPLLIVPEENYAIISFAHDSGSLPVNFKGRLMIFNLAGDSELIKEYYYGTGVITPNQVPTTSFPLRGLSTVCYLNGKIYGGFTYDTHFDEEDKNGLCVIDLTTNTISYHIPSVGDSHPNGYRFTDIEIMDDTRLLISSYYGVYIFDTSDNTWQIFNNDTVPGLTPRQSGFSSDNSFLNIAYDALNEMIFAGTAHIPATWFGLAMFSEDGYIKRSRYITGTYSGTWTWGADSAWVQGTRDYDASVSVVDNSFFTFWVNEDVDTNELSIMWDFELVEYELTSHLVRDAEVTITRTIDGTPAQLSFSLSHGHLFDPHNNNSLLREYVTKFRLLTVRFGEKVNNVDYWIEQGSFIVSEVRLSYKRGEYPVLSVVAEDRRILWQEHEIIATEFYDDYPEPVLIDLLTEHANMEEEDIDIVDFDIREEIWIQWTDTALKEIIDKIVNRFGYFSRMTVDDKFQTRKISRENEVDHVYADMEKIVEFTPDDTYSDFVNHVIVTGEERAKIQVMHAEERITNLTGTVGWWGGSETHRVYYSEDRSRTVVNPRLEEIQFSRSIIFQLNDYFDSVTVEISDIDPYNQWVEITIDVPNLLPWFILGVALILAGSSELITNYLISAGMIFSLTVLSSVINYSYDIYGNPIGRVRRSIQGEANDEEMQTNLGFVVTRKFDDDLCFTIEGCVNVAEFELMIAQLQRRRVRFTKIAHLQDEEGDTIQVPHPYTEQVLTVFITNLTRKFKKAEGSEKEGYFYDDIEGWVIE